MAAGAQQLASVGTVFDVCLEPGHPVSLAPQRSGSLQRDAKHAGRLSGRQPGDLGRQPYPIRLVNWFMSK